MMTQNELYLGVLAQMRSFEELYHHGILGQKWGVRRYQNKDGTLTSAGEKKYAKKFLKDSNNRKMSYDKIQKKYSENGLLKTMANDPNIRKTITEHNKSQKEAREYEDYLENKVLSGKKITNSEISKNKQIRDKSYNDLQKVGKAFVDHFGDEKVAKFAYMSHVSDYMENEEH